MKVVSYRIWMEPTEVKWKSNEFGEAIWSLGVLVLLGFLAFWLFGSFFALPQFALIYYLFCSLHSFLETVHGMVCCVVPHLLIFNIISQLFSSVAWWLSTPSFF